MQEAAGIGTIWDLIAYGKLDNSINLIPISSEGAMTYILNIIMFMPFGFLLPLIWKNFRNAKKSSFDGIFDVVGDRNLSAIQYKDNRH